MLRSFRGGGCVFLYQQFGFTREAKSPMTGFGVVATLTTRPFRLNTLKFSPWKRKQFFYTSIVTIIRKNRVITLIFSTYSHPPALYKNWLHECNPDETLMILSPKKYLFVGNQYYYEQYRHQYRYSVGHWRQYQENRRTCAWYKLWEKKIVPNNMSYGLYQAYFRLNTNNYFHQIPAAGGWSNNKINYTR